jgi:hypothetical protein
MVASGTYDLLVEAVRRAFKAGDIAARFAEEDVVFAAWSLVHGMVTLMITQLYCIDYDWEGASRRMLKAWFDGLK